MDYKEIYLPEHNGTMPVFLSIQGKPGNITAEAYPITDVASFRYYTYYYYYNTLGIGKLTNDLYIFEDLGTYDNNIELRAYLKFTPENTKAEPQYGYGVRGFEYGSASDRLYTSRRGSTKVLLITGDQQTNDASFLIKWEKYIPPYKEVISSDKKSVTMYSSSASGLTEKGTVSLTNTIGSTTIDNSMFSDYHIEDMNFYSLSVNYTAKENNTSEPRFGLLGITSTIDRVEVGWLDQSLSGYGRYMDYWGYQFVIQAPKSGWICAKTPALHPSYSYNYRRTPVYMDSQGTNFQTDPTETHFSIDGAELNGFYANADGKYEIYNNLPEDYYSTEDANYFSIYVPTIFNVTSYEVVAKDGTTSENMPERINMYAYITNKNTFINDLDGIEYTAYMFDCADYLEKIILTVE